MGSAGDTDFTKFTLFLYYPRCHLYLYIKGTQSITIIRGYLMAIDPNMKEKARFLYKQGYSVTRIAEETGLNQHTLMSWIDKGSRVEKPWKEIRMIEKHNELKEHLERNNATTSEVFDMGLELVWRSMKEMLTGNVNLNEKGVNTMMNVLDKIERWKQNEETSKDFNLSAEEAKNLLDSKNLFGDN